MKREDNNESKEGKNENIEDKNEDKDTQEKRIKGRKLKST